MSTVHQLRQIASLTLLLLGAGASSADAVPYTFTRIIRSGPEFESFNPDVSLNNLGQVAFSGSRASGGSGIFMGSGGPVTPLVEVGVAPVDGVGAPRLNDVGQVAFFAGRNDRRFLARAENGQITTIVHEDGPLNSLNQPNLNNAGDVPFVARFDGGTTRGLFIGDGGPVTTLYSGVTFNGGPRDEPAINDAGHIAFRAFDGPNNDHKLFLYRDGTFTVLQTANTGAFQAFDNIRINASDDVFFWSPGAPLGYEALYRNRGGVNQMLVDNSGPFARMSGLDANDLGQIAFEGVLKNDPNPLDGSQQYGIFTGPSLADDVIQIGDVVDGLVVSGLSRSSLNNLGQVAFLVDFSNGQTGIYRANPVPEPSTLALAGLAAALVIVGRVRKCQRPEELLTSSSWNKA